MNTTLIHIHNYATSDALLGESNILRQITNYWDKEIIKSLLFKLRRRPRTKQSRRKNPGYEEEIDFENSQPNREKKIKGNESRQRHKSQSNFQFRLRISQMRRWRKPKKNEYTPRLKQQNKIRKKKDKHQRNDNSTD